MANVSLKEAQALAIAAARQSNINDRYNWKTVSMNKDGYWFADECLPEEMTIDHSWGIHSAPYGADILLNVPKCDTSICDWEKSVAEVN